MTRRTRSVVIDGTLPVGRLFSGTNNSSTATADKQIAGARASAVTTRIKPVSSPISTTIATKGSSFITGGLITEITYSFTGKILASASPLGRSVIVRLRKRSAAGTTTNIAEYTLPVGVLNGTITTDPINITARDIFFWDVLQVGSSRPGQGLAITIKYFKA
jgi:hypothetical protein